MTINIGIQFKKIKGEWRYYPFSYHTDPDIYMIVKPGRKEEMEEAIAKEWIYAASMPAISISLVWINSYLLFVPFIIFLLTAIKLRTWHEKKYCEYKPYKIRDGIKNYYRKLLIYAYFNAYNLRLFFLGSLFFSIGTYASYVEKGFILWHFAGILMSFLGLFHSFNIIYAKYLVKKHGLDFLKRKINRHIGSA
ncbi:MAG: hypothetical protein H7A09_01555 [Oceanospirillaceae bacterium]|nr:hypothetical protein [Oceanospirillaceae bacterium]